MFEIKAARRVKMEQARVSISDQLIYPSLIRVFDFHLLHFIAFPGTVLIKCSNRGREGGAFDINLKLYSELHY